MKINTKDRILSKATKLFNKKGFANITLVDIADALGMTRGNLAYHFKNKDILLQEISAVMWAKLEIERNKTQLLPSFQNIHNEIQLLFNLQREYSFIFLDPYVMKNTVFKSQFKAMADRGIMDMKAAIAFSISSGNMKPEPFEGYYDNLTFSAWMVSFFWIYQQEVRSKKEDDTEGEKKLWILLVPHFTDKGLKAFKTYFGKNYFSTLGKPFKSEISHYMPEF